MKETYERIEIHLRPEIAELLEEARGKIPRATFVRDLVRDHLRDTLGEKVLEGLVEPRRLRVTPTGEEVERVEFHLHPKLAKLIDDQGLPRATFIRSIIKNYLREMLPNESSDIQKRLKDEGLR